MLTSINIRNLRNASYISYCDGIVAIGLRHDLTALGLKPSNDAFAATLVPLNAQYATERGSSLTDQIVAADKRRDKAVTGILQVTEGYLNHFDPAMAAAATVVKRVFEKYGSSIANLNYTDQSGVMKSLAEDLQTVPVSASVTLLGLTAWVVEMKAANTAFVDLYGTRTTEISQKPSSKMLDLRLATLQSWQKLVRSTLAVNELSPGPGINAYMAEINAHNDQYNRLIGKGGDEESVPVAPTA